MTDGADACRPHPNSPWRRAAGWLLSLAILAAVVVTLRGRFSAVSAAGGLPGPVPAALAVLANLAANAVLVRAWQEVLLAGGVRLRTPVAAWVWGVSQLARYTVGAAQVGGRAVVGRRYGVPATAGALTTLVEVAWQTSITAVLALVTLPWWLPGARALQWLAVVAAVPAAVLLFGLADPQRLLTGVTAVFRRPLVRRLAGHRAEQVAADLVVRRATALRLTLLYATNSALRLGSFLVLFAAVGGHLGQEFLRAVGAYALGQMLGRIAVFAPGGLGPREGATALVVSPAIGGTSALILVAAVRLLEMLAEGLFFLLTAAVRPRGGTAAQP